VFYEDPKTLTGAGYSVSLFTKWGKDTIDQTWVKAELSDKAGSVLAGIAPEPTSRKELAPGVGDNLTEQGGVPGPWLNRLPHFRLDATPSAGDEIQTEYFIERSKIVDAVKAVNEVASEINPTLIISEIRTIKKDDAWLSPMSRADSVALHFTWINDTEAVDKAVDVLEKVLADFDPIPHWGKVHHFDKADLERVYPKLSDAKKVFDALDPKGTFSSEYLRSLGIRS
jgi:alditol oxidase